MSNVTMSMDQSSITFLVDALFLANQGLFTVDKVVSHKILGRDLGLEIFAGPSKPPVVKLAPLSAMAFHERIVALYGARDVDGLLTANAPSDTTPTANVGVEFDEVAVAAYEHNDGKRGKELLKLSVGVSVTCVVSVANSTLSFRAIEGQIISGGSKDPIASFVLQQVIQALESKVDDLPLPRLELLMGLSATVDSATIANGAVTTGITLDGTKQKLPLAAVAKDKPVPLPGEARIVGSANADAINIAIASQFPKLSSQWEHTESAGPLAVRVTAFAGVRTPTVSIASGVATASSELGVKATVGVKLGGGRWYEQTLPPGDVALKLLVQADKSSDGKSIYLKLIPEFDSISIDWVLPLGFPFNLARKLITKLLDALLEALVVQMKGKFPGITINVYSVEDPITILNVDLDVKFAEFGLSKDQLATTVVATGS